MKSSSYSHKERRLTPAAENERERETRDLSSCFVLRVIPLSLSLSPSTDAFRAPYILCKIRLPSLSFSMLILAGKSIVLYVVVVCDFVFFVVSLALGFEFVVCVCSSMLHLICFSGCVIVSSVSPSRWFSGFSETDSWSWSWSWCYGFYFVGFTRWMGVQIVSAEFDWDAIVLGFITVSISALLILNFLFSTWSHKAHLLLYRLSRIRPWD